MPMYKRSMLILLFILLGVTGVGLYNYYSDSDMTELDLKVADTGEGKKQAVNNIVVYVSGEVKNSGMVNLPEGSRVADAINACGGVLPTADTNAINMAQELKDGMQIKVPEKSGQGKTEANNFSKSGGADTKKDNASKNNEEIVNINQADIKGLETLPGIGPAMAQRIIDYRTENGTFQSTEDLRKVKGIGQAKYEKIKDRVTT